MFAPEAMPRNCQSFSMSRTVTNNSYGVSIGAGFPFRADPRLWSGNFQATFSGNSIVASTSAAALITCTRELKNDYKYLQDATIAITDLDGDLDGYWFDHPATDPIDGRFLKNTLTVNGMTMSTGRNFREDDCVRTGSPFDSGFSHGLDRWRKSGGGSCVRPLAGNHIRAAEVRNASTTAARAARRWSFETPTLGTDVQTASAAS